MKTLSGGHYHLLDMNDLKDVLHPFCVGFGSKLDLRFSAKKYSFIISSALSQLSNVPLSLCICIVVFTALFLSSLHRLIVTKQFKFIIIFFL